jgi:ADP-L-glycero-D-manno-heptose 6-epimerase
MLIVTGGAGFIGSNLVHELNAHGLTDILVVDNFANVKKFPNLNGARYVDFMDKREFRRAIRENALDAGKVEAILHQGACSNTLEDDGVYMMDNNFQYTREVLAFAIREGAPLVFASTAAVYGHSGPGHFTPTLENEHPLNIYGYSKLVFDHYFRHQLELDRVPITAVGLRYFNVYGPREQHKGRMASVIHHFTRQMKETGKVCLFSGTRPGPAEHVFCPDRSLRSQTRRGTPGIPGRGQCRHRRKPQLQRRGQGTDGGAWRDAHRIHSVSCRS